MKISSRFITTLLIAILLSRCGPSRITTIATNTSTPFSLSTPIPVTYTPKATPTAKKLSRIDFDFLKRGISFDEVVANLGPPEMDVGSGIHIYRYELSDGTYMNLGFINNDQLYYAIWENRNYEIKEVLVEPTNEN